MAETPVCKPNGEVPDKMLPHFGAGKNKGELMTPKRPVHAGGTDLDAASLAAAAKRGG